MAAWNYIEYYTDDAHTSLTGIPTTGYDSFTIGLFGIDMTEFIYDCELSTYCDIHDYEYFDGWGIGMFAYHSPDTTKTQGFCFTSDSNCVFLYYDDGEDVTDRYYIKVLQSTEVPDENNPTTL